jgi:hypothetical protein
MASSDYNKFVYGFGSPVRLRGDLTFTTTGGPVAFTSTTQPKNLDIYSVTQMIASSAVYLVTLSASFIRLLNAGFVTYGQKSTVASGNFHVAAHEVGGGIAMVTFRTAAANDTITINGVTFTCKTSGAGANEFDTGGATNATTATNFAAAVNASTSAGITSAGITASVVTDSSAMGNASVVAIKSTKPDIVIYKTVPSATTIVLNAPDAKATTVRGKLKPGLIVVSNVGVTPTTFASGDAIRFWVDLENSGANPSL